MFEPLLSYPVNQKIYSHEELWSRINWHKVEARLTAAIAAPVPTEEVQQTISENEVFKNKASVLLDSAEFFEE